MLSSRKMFDLKIDVKFMNLIRCIMRKESLAFDITNALQALVWFCAVPADDRFIYWWLSLKMIQKANSLPPRKLKQLMTLIANSAPYVYLPTDKTNSGRFEEVALGIWVILYLDDMLILSTTWEWAKKGLAVVLELFAALRFVVNTKKSVMDLTQSLEFLGFVIDTQWMKISLPIEKLKSIWKLAGEIRRHTALWGKWPSYGDDGGSSPSSLASSPSLQMSGEDKNAGPTTGPRLRGTPLSESKCPQGVHIWIKEADQHNGRSLCITQWDLTIETDASTKAWDASCQEMTTGESGLLQSDWLISIIWNSLLPSRHWRLFWETRGEAMCCWGWTMWHRLPSSTGWMASTPLPSRI